ncbi:MAG: hypothetical protein DHS20C17_16970 [Cyclobacteriaceae bacterium]|nr:MAG: hypothetical protein DHS20C17_16970 [Cyclobacteriaceae bacterium]
MQEFLLLIHGDKYQDETAEGIKLQMEKYMRWMEDLTTKGKYVGGARLASTGNFLSDKHTIISDGPFLEPKEIIGGYILIKAENLEEATKEAQNCPLSDEFSISVRPMYQWPKIS